MPEIFESMLLYLKENNCNNLNDFILKALKKRILKIYSTTKQNNQVYSHSLKQIHKSNFLIADVTYASITIGRQIEYALQKGIPVLCLINTDKTTYISPSMFDVESETQTFRSYGEKTLPIILKGYIKNYKNKKIRFNLFISRESENFLNWLSIKNQTSKSETVRKLIENEIKKNKEYKIFK